MGVLDGPLFFADLHGAHGVEAAGLDGLLESFFVEIELEELDHGAEAGCWVGLEVFVAQGEDGELVGGAPGSGVLDPRAEAEAEPVGVAACFDEAADVAALGEGAGALAGELAVVECAEDDIARVSDDVDGAGGFAQSRVLVGELEVGLHELEIGWGELPGDLAVDVGDALGDLDGFGGRAEHVGVEHEAEPGVAGLWV